MAGCCGGEGSRGAPFFVKEEGSKVRFLPLYYYTDIYMLDDSVQGFFSNPLGYKYFMHCTIAK